MGWKVTLCGLREKTLSAKGNRSKDECFKYFDSILNQQQRIVHFCLEGIIDFTSMNRLPNFIGLVDN